MQEKTQKRNRRHRRIRAKIKGTKECPRLSVFRSDRHLYIQLIDDQAGKTLLSKKDSDLKTKGAGQDMAKRLGLAIAEDALKAKIEKVVFDRGGYNYHGRVKAIAEGAREGGLKF